MNFSEARTLVQTAIAKGRIVPAPVKSDPPAPPKLRAGTGKAGIKCRWCGHKKRSYGTCDRCGRKSNTWSAKRASS